MPLHAYYANDCTYCWQRPTMPFVLHTFIHTILATCQFLSAPGQSGPRSLEDTTSRPKSCRYLSSMGTSPDTQLSWILSSGPIPIIGMVKTSVP